ncbi:MAG: exopolysaccharide biosynthesis polyprenyl glycosylphosphotransferase [Kiritimatiellae bacterium]|nr:exopolysaccharide biosynthesis polyprenyl glycosylphosphotransferase [Kiritimatiellia bacterium]
MNLRRWWASALAMLAADSVVLLVSLLVGDGVMRWVAGSPIALRYSLLVIPAWWLTALWSRTAPGWGLNAVSELRKLEQSLALLFGFVAVAVFVGRMGDAASRGSYLIAYASAAVLMPATRAGLRAFLSRQPWWGAHAVLYGHGPLAEAIAQVLISEPALGYRLRGVFGVESIAGLPRLGGLMDAAPEVDTAFFVDQNLDATTRERLMEGPLASYRRLIVLPDVLDAPSVWVEPRDFSGILGLEATNNLLDLRARALKRAMDLVIALVLAPVWGGLLGLLALLVWAGDRHAPFFSQERVGRSGQRFRMWKLRTMVPDAEAQLAERLLRDPELRREWEQRGKLARDWRITPVGRFLRRWSLDELPQLWHVLRGEMSLVGPRPLPPSHHAALSPTARSLRERVRPGMTGLWQIRGRSETDADTLGRWDAYYVRNWSVWLDAMILVHTLGAVLRGDGAR